jgi:hypothetical protein
MTSPSFAPRRRTFGRSLLRALLLGAPAAALAALAAPSCTTVDVDGTVVEETPDAGPTETLAPGEVCEAPPAEMVTVRFQPTMVALTPCADPASNTCAKRRVKVVVDPDFCAPVPLSFESSSPDLPTPAAAKVDLHRSAVDLEIVGAKAAGSSTLTVRVPRGDGTDATATLAVETLEAALPTCAGDAAKGTVEGGGTLSGGAGKAGASMGLQKGAEKPDTGSTLWGVAAFEGTIACAADVVPAGTKAIGPAITFGPATSRFKRDVPLSVPLNPALLPDAARMRHVELAYSSPAFKKPRTVPVADLHVEKVDGQWALTVKAPRLGTYQAVVRSDAGTKSFKRRITHRAVIGISMGGGGTAMFGMRHHDLFDVLAPLGGPVDWTWMLDNIKENHLGGFRPIAKGTTLADIQLVPTACTTKADCKPDEVCLGEQGLPPGKCVLMPAAPEPYAHAQTFNTWWYEYPRSGNGGRFPRSEYTQIFRDLGLMFGNPNGDNLAPNGENLPAGVPPTDKSVLGDHPGDECRVWVDPLDGPDKEKQQAIEQTCPAERCAHTLTLQGYYDDEYNPDGTFPVITVCDGSEQNEALSPYANSWKPEGNGIPLEVGLAVDYNGNGVRDELEPIIRAGHEPWQDVGEDGIPSEKEPGYQPGVNDDPNGDDYDAQYNPTGTERDHRRQEGEPFDDVGLDGVKGTKQQPAGGYAQPGDGYDVGEGDGKFTVSHGLQTFWDRDSHSVVRRWTKDVPGGELDDAALRRLDVWTDGGTRDLFNFGVDAQHLAGTFKARGRGVSYLTDFTQIPGLDPQQQSLYEPEKVVWEDLGGIVFQRYGKIDPTTNDLEMGSGQHVGTVYEIASRLQSALYFIGSRWPEPELRTQVETSNSDAYEGATDCEVIGNCTFDFTSKDGRTGPVGVTLPPGYAHRQQQDRHYPVIYMLHGYGQTPEDLEAAIVFLRNWMNSPTKSGASRLPKAILVYVDGRCRVGATGKAECIRGSFFTNSVRKDGVQDEQWWLELMDHVDKKFRTMGESVVDWTE